MSPSADTVAAVPTDGSKSVSVKELYTELERGGCASDPPQ
jgi:hypothetical protein